MLAKIEGGLQVALKQNVSNLREAAKAISFLLSQTALIAFVFALWRLGADLSWAGAFIVSDGLLSHWQVWLAVAVVTQMMSVQLNRLINTTPGETAR